MKMNNLGYLMKEGIRSIFSHGLMSFASVCVTVACMIIVGSFSILMYNLNIMVDELNQTNEVICYVDSVYTDAEAKSVHSRINMIDNVFRADYVSREEALENFIEDHDNDSAFQGVDPQDLRHRIVVVLEDNSRMEETVALLEQVDGVAMIDAEFELAEGFTTISSVLGLVSTGIIAILLIVSLLIISNTVKLAMYDRKNEIAIMKMVGATDGFIRAPFVVEGMTLGLLGGIIAMLTEWGVYGYITEKLVASSGLFTMVGFDQLWLQLLPLMLGAGVIIGILGSTMTIRKFLRV